MSSNLRQIISNSSSSPLHEPGMMHWHLSCIGLHICCRKGSGSAELHNLMLGSSVPHKVSVLTCHSISY